MPAFYSDLRVYENHQSSTTISARVPKNGSKKTNNGQAKTLASKTDFTMSLASFRSGPSWRRGLAMEIDDLRACLREGDSGRDNWNARRLNAKWGHETMPRPLTVRLKNNVKVSLAPPNLWLADLSKQDLSGYNLSGAFLSGAHLQDAILRNADLSGAHLIVTDLRRCDLRGADLSRANLLDANLAGADLSNSSLTSAMMLRTNIGEAILDHSDVHGVSTWGVMGLPRSQKDLVITTLGEPTITVDNLEVAQFVYLLLHNHKIRDVIDTITSKVVLILGRFTAKRKAVLDAIREELRRRAYLPVLFDFDKPANRDLTETISLLARMAFFVVADITDAEAIPQELKAIVPDLPSVPVQPLLLKGSSKFGMFEHYERFPWVLPLYQYETERKLIAALRKKVIEPAERKALEMRS